MNNRRSLGSRYAILMLLICAGFALVGCSVSSVTNNGNCDAQGYSNAIKCIQPSNGAAPSKASDAGTAVSPSPEPSESPTANGALLGSYSIVLAAGYTVPLGAAKPALSEYSSTGVGDLEKVYSRLQPAGNDQLESLSGGVMPTYQNCSTPGDFTGMIIPYAGTSFCLIETAGLIAGGTVTAISSGDYASNAVTIKICVWRYAG